MKTILYSWELGAGLGHLLRIKPVLTQLAAKGHRLFAAVPDIANAAAHFDSTQITLLQSPVHATSLATTIEPMRSFPQIMFNHGFGNLTELTAKTDAALHTIDSISPDLVICDHALSTLLALQTRKIRKITIGCGFCAPADQFPFRDLRPWLPPAADQLLQDEQTVLHHINRYLESKNRQSLSRVGQLFSHVDSALLSTIPELDPYASWRNHETYLPPAYDSEGTVPVWPSNSTKKCFVYLRLHKNLPAILKSLGLLPFSTLAFIPNCPPEIVKSYSRDNLHIASTPFDINHVTREADIAILNGGINLATSFLLKGILLVVLPVQLEQTLTAKTIHELQLGKHIDLAQPEMIGVAVHETLETPIYQEKARIIAEKYQNILSNNMTDTIVSTIEKWV